MQLSHLPPIPLTPAVALHRRAESVTLLRACSGPRARNPHTTWKVVLTSAQVVQQQREESNKKKKKLKSKKKMKQQM